MQVNKLDDGHGTNQEDQNLSGLPEVMEEYFREIFQAAALSPGSAQVENVIVVINNGQSTTAVTDGNQRPNDGSHQQRRNRFVQTQRMLENDCEVSNDKTEYYYSDHERNNYNAAAVGRSRDERWSSNLQQHGCDVA